MDQDQLTRQIIDTLTGIAPEVEAGALDPEVSFRDQFEIDSVDFLNFVLRLEQELGVKIPEVDYPKLSSLKGCLSYLGRALGG
jgi:acyl carrier protein